MDHEARPRAGPARARRTHGVHLTERDRELLAFMAEHRFVLRSHVQVLLGITSDAAYARLRLLYRAGYVSPDRQLQAAPGWYQISRSGLNAIASDLPKPRRVDLRCHHHDVGLAWLHLAARHGAFGPVNEAVSERRMRSSDGRTPTREDRFGVRLGGVGPGGRDRLHYPDLILATASGHRVALELELSSKSRTRREGILAAYGGDARIDAVVYLVESASVGSTVSRSASRLDLSSLVHVQRVQFADSERSPEPERPAERVRRTVRAPTAGARSPEHSR